MIVSVFRLYFWLPQLLWMFILWFVSPNEQAARRLRWLPTHYDEFIVLPLPLLGKFLATAYRYNQAGVRQVIDRLTTHSRQQGAALTAQILIALGQLARCDNLQAIAGAHRELRWVAAPPPPGTGRCAAGPPGH